MTGRFAIRASAFCCTAFLLAAPAGGEEPLPTKQPLIEETRVRLQTVRLRIEPTSAGSPGSCLALDENDLRVLLRGERLDSKQIVELERARQPTIHALLIDTSGSMIGKLDYARQAASAYVAELRPGHERALIASFDDSMILAHGVTSDRDALRQAIDRLHVGGYTTMRDGLGYAFRELAGQDARPVVLLLTDGMDSASFYDRSEVMGLVKQLPELTVFTIGLGLPPIVPYGFGAPTPKKFLQDLSRRTNGAFFDVPTGSGLEPVFLSIREMLDSEALLTVRDPDPEAEQGKLKVRSENPACRIRVYRQWKIDEDDPRRAPILDRGGPPLLLAWTPERRYRRLYVNRAHHVRHAGCSTRLARPASETDVEMIDAGWFAEVLPGSIRGCFLDLTTQTGLLYDPDELTRATFNGWLQLRTRRFEIALPPPEQLPTAPVQLMDDLARHALSVASARPEAFARHSPPERHARPYHDYPMLIHPMLIHGRVLLENRPRLARALWARPDYRDRAQRKLLAEADAKMRVLREKLRRAAPDLSDDLLDLALYQSPEAQAVLARAQTPSELDLQRHLAAWLGDVPAAELFARWETGRIDDLLERGTTLRFGSTFYDEWRELRRIFFVPSYARVLALLSPGYDPTQDRIGFWRVVLPRVAWFQERVKGPLGNPRYDSLPMDLIPDLPLGYWLVENELAGRPGLARRLVERGYRVASLALEPLAPPRKQDPRKAFRRSRVTLILEAEAAGPTGPARSEWIAELELPKKSLWPELSSLSITAQGDERLAALITDEAIPSEASRTRSTR
jgi:hypothetical protein